jgi:hypothetical protein
MASCVESNSNHRDNLMIRVYDEAGNVIQTHEQNGEFCGP